jgi:hypothetical protein
LNILVLCRQLIHTVLLACPPRVCLLLLLLQQFVVNPTLELFTFFFGEQRTLPMHDGIVEVEAFVVRGFLTLRKGRQFVDDVLLCSPIPEVPDFLSERRFFWSEVTDGVCVMELIGSGFSGDLPSQVEEDLGLRRLGT